MYNKPVIVFEGIECSGKSLHIKNVCKYLKKKNISYLYLREPGGSKNSEIIRKLILNKKSNFNRNTDLFLYSASRSENIQKLRKFQKKKIILIDRFTDSTLAYQHFGLGVDINLIKKSHNVILDDFKVDFTFLNIVNNKNMLSRLKRRKISLLSNQIDLILCVNDMRLQTKNPVFFKTFNKVREAFIQVHPD